jgi:hypothetical protein
MKPNQYKVIPKIRDRSPPKLCMSISGDGSELAQNLDIAASQQTQGRDYPRNSTTRIIDSKEVSRESPDYD